MASSVSLSHKVWAAGHVLVLLGTLSTLLNIFSSPFPRKSYRLAYAGVIISWSLVVYKTRYESSNRPGSYKNFINQLLYDENVLYLLVALTFFLLKPIALSLIPFAIFSTFHILTFVRTLLPRLPEKKDKKEADVEPTGAARISKMLQVFVKENYERAMRFVAFFEVFVILGQIVFGTILFKYSIISLMVYVHFILLRRSRSPYTAEAVQKLNGQVDQLTNHPSCPPFAKKAVGFIRQATSRYVQGVNVQTASETPQRAAKDK